MGNSEIVPLKEENIPEETKQKVLTAAKEDPQYILNLTQERGYHCHACVIEQMKILWSYVAEMNQETIQSIF